MKTTLKLVGILFVASSGAYGQVEPAATTGSAHLTYALHYAQRDTSESHSQGSSQSFTGSGSVDYFNGSKLNPFKLDYSGGYQSNLTGQSYYPNGFFQHLLLSQGFVVHRWTASMSDNVSYLPEFPSTGFSGMTGIGEPIGGSGSVPSSSQTILSQDIHCVENSAHGSIEHPINYATNLSFGGAFQLLRFPDSNGLDTDGLTTDAMLSRRLNSRNSLSGQYLFSRYTYPGFGFSLRTDTALVGYTRKWSRRLATTTAAGPQSLQRSDAALGSFSTRISANASVDCALRFGAAYLTYSHGIMGGSGYLFGAEGDAAAAGVVREFGRNLAVGLEERYYVTTGLTNHETTNGEIGAVQATRRLGRNFSIFANYTAMNQSPSSSLPANVQKYLLQTVSFGIGYSPRELHLSH